MRALIAVLPLLAVACGGGVITVDDTGETGDTGDTSDTGDTADTSDTEPACQATVTSLSPANNATNVSVTRIVSAQFSHPVDPGDWSLSVDGVSGTAALASNSLSATFVADAAFSTSTAYTARAEACDDHKVSHFTTASGPLPEEDLDGRTYAIDFEDITWAQPTGLGMLGALAAVEYVLVAVLDVDTDDETIETAGSLGISDPADVSATPQIIQDPCVEPVQFGEADFSSNPVFEIGPADFPLDFSGQVVEIDDAHVVAVFVEDGAAIEDIQISGQLDTAIITAELGFDICSNPLLPITCVACNEAPSSITCLDVLLTADRGEWQENIAFHEGLDPSLNVDCQ